MGYSLKIGEPLILYDKENDEYFSDVKLERNEAAPCYGEVTDYENRCLPNYESWHEFVEVTDLDELFFDNRTGLMRSHGGQYALFPEHLMAVEKAIDNLTIKFPDAEALLHRDDAPPGSDYLARLLWLKFWMQWALDNCKKAVFYNG